MNYQLSNTNYQNHFLKQQEQQNNKNDNCKVIIRVRPPLPREVQDGRFISTIQVSPNHNKICIYEYYNLELVESAYLQEYLNNPNSYTMHQFSFDYIYDQDSTQEEVYSNTARNSVISTLQGYNSTIMAYGQTGTGKTFTMEGFKYNNQDPARGIIPRAIEEIFKYIESSSNENTTFMVRASYLQIYNEVISDLLRTDRTSLPIREDKKRGVFVEGLSEWAVRNPTEIYSLIQKGAQTRATASTKMNNVSSRSHAVFIIIVEQMTVASDYDPNTPFEEVPKEIKVGKLNLVDLAGSERVRVTGATGKRLEECKKINQSLSCLGNVISALTEGRSTHIPYRNSKLTRILEDSLGGNCKTTMMAMISPALDSFPESLSSLKFANRAKNIKCSAIVNEDVDQRALIKKYEAELKKLKAELQDRQKNTFDKTQLSKLEADRQKALLDKKMAMAALEERSKEFFMEREQKKMLEDKIKAINSQLLVGGHQINDLPQIRSALEEQQRIKTQYEKKLQELENEREQIEEDKAQVDRYKELLIKQRDIMIAITSRLNERDETIIQLQEELDAYDRIHRETEEMLENKSARVSQLEQILQSRNIELPEFEAKQLEQKSNQDVVKYQGLETFNITKENLQSVVVEKMQKLSEENTNQQQEINRLKKELTQLSENNQTVNSSQMASVQQQSHLEGQVEQLQQEIQSYELNQNNLVKQIEDQQSKYQEQSESITEYLSSYNFQIKNQVDGIIEILTQEPNDPMKLQNVAKDLLSLQRIVNTSIQQTGDQSQKSLNSSSAFSNISNTFHNQNSNRPSIQIEPKQQQYMMQQQQQSQNSSQYQQEQQQQSIYNDMDSQNMQYLQQQQKMNQPQMQQQYLGQQQQVFNNRIL